MDCNWWSGDEIVAIFDNQDFCVMRRNLLLDRMSEYSNS